MKPHELVASFAAAVSCGEPMAAARAALEELRNHIAEVDETLRYISGVGGNARQVFYRSPELTLSRFAFLPDAARRHTTTGRGRPSCSFPARRRTRSTAWRMGDCARQARSPLSPARY